MKCLCLIIAAGFHQLESCVRKINLLLSFELYLSGFFDFIGGLFFHLYNGRDYHAQRLE